jgi:hypothetical protein
MDPDERQGAAAGSLAMFAQDGDIVKSKMSCFNI